VKELVVTAQASGKRARGKRGKQKTALDDAEQRKLGISVLHGLAV